MFTRVTKQDNILNAPSTLIFVINIQSMTHNPFIDANTFCLVAVLSLYLWTAGQAVGGGRSITVLSESYTRLCPQVRVLPRASWASVW